MKVHFLGIGGSGASAAAAITQSQGFEVDGCDLEPSNEFTTQFKPNQLLRGHSSEHLRSHPGGAKLILAVTPAIYSLDPNNSELIEAKKQGIEILTWQEFMGKYLMKDKFVIAVSGTHGKTTTTAMIAKLLEDGGLDPTVELGAIVPWWGTNYRVGQGKYFVVEADEYNDNFFSIKPDISVVTNIEMDHPEYFKDFESYKESFKKILLQTKGAVVANLSDVGVRDVIASAAKQSTTSNKIASSPAAPRNDGVQVIDYSKQLVDFPLQVPGEFNRWNASAAFQVGLLLHINPQTITQSLQTFTGTSRRFEYIGEFNKAKVYSDFGHHPTEIRETLKAVREKFPNQRILLIYQPHMFTRTKYLFDDFVKVFKDLPVDKVFIMDIYQSREKDLGQVSSKQLVAAIQKDWVPKSRNGEKVVPNKKSVIYIGATNQTLEKIKPEIKPGDILFFMSAGDTDKLAKQLVKET